MTAARWLAQQITIVGPDRDRTDVDGFVSPAYPGFAVVVHGDGGYGVTHVATGFAIARYFVSRAAATGLIRELAALPGWSRDVVALRADAALSAAVWRIRADFYAREESGEFGPVDQELIAELMRFEGRLEEAQPTKQLGEQVRAKGGRR